MGSFRTSDGYSSLYVRVKRMEDLEPVRTAIEAMGFGVISIADQLEELKREFLIAVFSDFEGASVGAIRQTGAGHFEVDCLQEADVPEMAFNRVFYDYNFAVGVRNTAAEVREVRIRLRLCERSAKRNLSFMLGPYWIKEGRGWRHLLPSNHQHGED